MEEKIPKDSIKFCEMDWTYIDESQEVLFRISIITFHLINSDSLGKNVQITPVLFPLKMIK